MAAGRTGPRVVLALYGLFGVGTAWSLLTERSSLFMANYLAYHRAAEAVIAGEDLYAVTHPEAPAFPFVYPPIVAPAWLPATPVDPWIGYVVQTAVSVGFAIAIAVVAVRLVEATGIPLEPLDRLLLGWAAVGSTVSLPTLFYGNINLVLAGSLAVGVWLLVTDRPWSAGAAFGLAGLVKVFPAAFGLWLVGNRSWRSVASWSATGAAGLGAGIVAFGPATTATWVREALLVRVDPGFFGGGMPENAGYVSLRQPIGLLLDADGWPVALVAVALVAPVVAATLADLRSPRGRLIALLGVTAGTLLIVPAYYLYLVFVFPALFPLAYLLEDGRPRRLFLVGMALVAVTLTPADVGRVDLGVIGDLLSAVMTVARPPLIGLVVVLLACVIANGALTRATAVLRRLAPSGI